MIQIAETTAIGLGTIIFSIGGAWVMVKSMQKKVDESVAKSEFEELKSKTRDDFANLKKDLLEEIRGLKSMLFDGRGQSIYRPRLECVDERITWTTAINAIHAKLGEMDMKRDTARTIDDTNRLADLKSMSELKQSIALIKQRLNMHDESEDL